MGEWSRTKEKAMGVVVLTVDHLPCLYWNWPLVGNSHFHGRVRFSCMGNGAALQERSVGINAILELPFARISNVIPRTSVFTSAF